jgi:integrase
MVTNYADIAGLEGVSAHTLRYTFAHDALEENDPAEVAKMLGLRDVAGVRRYVDQRAENV